MAKKEVQQPDENLISINNQLEVLYRRRYSLNISLEDLNAIKRKWEDYYDCLCHAKNRYNFMLEDFLEHAKSLKDKNEKIKIFKRSFESIQKVIYGSQIQYTLEEISDNIRKTICEMDYNQCEIDKTRHQLWVVNEDIRKLENERSGYCG